MADALRTGAAVLLAAGALAASKKAPAPPPEVLDNLAFFEAMTLLESNRPEAPAPSSPSPKDAGAAKKKGDPL